LGWLKFVSAYVEKAKKILKNFIFALAPLRKWSMLVPPDVSGFPLRYKTRRQKTEF